VNPVAPLLSVRDVAKRLSLSESTVRGFVARGKIAHRRLGGAIRFTEEDLAEFIERCKRPIRESRHVPKQYPHLRPMKTFV
jgi:excisionase family DNA binding protein